MESGPWSLDRLQCKYLSSLKKSFFFLFIHISTLLRIAATTTTTNTDDDKTRHVLSPWYLTLLFCLNPTPGTSPITTSDASTHVTTIIKDAYDKRRLEAHVRLGNDTPAASLVYGEWKTSCNMSIYWLSKAIDFPNVY